MQKDTIIYKKTQYNFLKKDNLLFAPLNNNTEKCKSIVIYTEPKPKQRPRFTKGGHTYTPKQTQDYENLIRTAWKLMHKNTIFTGYIEMTLRFYMPIPKSWSKKKQEDAVNEVIRPATTPDIDNLVKAIQDGLNEIAFWDDKQIVDINASEYYAVVPRVEIEIKEL